MMASRLFLFIMDHSGLPVIIAICALGFSIVTTVIGVLLRLAFQSMKIEIGQIHLALTTIISKVQIDINERIDREANSFGEVAQAIRQKISDMEIWNRDTFVRRDSFYKVTETLSSDIEKLGNKIDERLERMEDKIDNKKKT